MAPSKPTSAPSLRASNMSYSPPLNKGPVNRGTDNMFQNTGDGSGNINNIERVDFIFSGFDVLTPQNQAHLNGVGFTVLERGGNDSIYVSAILGVNGTEVTKLSQPAFVAAGDWGDGVWDSSRETLVVRDTAVEGQFRPSTVTGTQQMYGLFFSLADLNVTTSDTVYGYALMSGDTNVNTITGTDYSALLDWTDTDMFPQDTGAGPGGLDLVSGGSAFIENELDTTGLFGVIPEPASSGLLAALGALMLVASRRRR
ncbi:MAG: PEP-CTERM sorting domain-containing protein [Puniceicoccaceae bacterium]|nr:MAG: PEP-CTERM sorting domain-containing protein [Puniceicoccaceae bacterium]